MNWSEDLEFLVLRVSHNFSLRSSVKKFYTKNSFQIYKIYTMHCKVFVKIFDVISVFSVVEFEGSILKLLNAFL